MGPGPLVSSDPAEIAGYRLRARLGSGGMGQVYLAFTPGGRPVALKVMHPQFAADSIFRGRFRQEVAAAKRVHGLYTAQVLDADPAAMPPWLVTAYVPGLSLHEAVTGYGPMPPRTVLLLIAGVAEALEAIHAAGVVHRDLKPSNVLLAPDGPRVIDFGIARAADDNALTGSGVRVGSPHYMAPEQVAGEPVSGAADVFALGAVAVYAATGRPAFGEGPAMAVMYRVRHQAPALSGCPPEVRLIAERCLAKNPADRPPPGEVLAWCRDQTADRTGQIAHPWLPPALTRALADPMPPPAPAVPPAAGPPRAPVSLPRTPPPSAALDTRRAPPAHGTTVAARARRRRSRAWGLSAGAAALAALAAGTWLAAYHPDAHPGSSAAPPSAAPRASWLSGTWTGTADQPAGAVTHWTAELSFSGSGQTGTFQFPTLGCSGNLVVTRLTSITATAREDITGNQRGMCAPGGLITLTRAATSMNMSWQDPSDHSNVATAHLGPAN